MWTMTILTLGVLAWSCAREPDAAGAPKGTPGTGDDVSLKAAAPPGERADPATPPPAPVPDPGIGGARAGQWYPGDAARAERTARDLLEQASGAPLDAVAALVVPHAGWRFSGPTAAHAWRAVYKNRYQRVLLLAPSHYVALGPRAVVTDAAAYRTPLGPVALDQAGARALAAKARFLVDTDTVAGEHALEVQMPWLRVALPDVPVLPVIVGPLDVAGMRALADDLREWVTDQTLVVVSSDFTHYGPTYGYRPFTDDVEANLKKLDMTAYAFLERKDLEGFAAFKEETGCTICGYSPLGVLLALLPADAQAKLLRYDTSGAQTGDFTNSVSYFALAFEGRWGAHEAPAFDPARWPLAHLTPEQKRTLVVLARRAVERYVRDGARVDPAAEGLNLDDVLMEPAGAFVTLKKKGILRGCIGEIPPRRPLVEVVIDHAIDAAVNDHRFQPVKPAELDDLDVEVSILTPPHPVASWRDVKVGTDGVVLSKAGRHAVFLPQVAPEQGWGLPEMLEHLSRKAGLPGDAWKEGAEFLVFQAVVFDEHELGVGPRALKAP